MREDNKEKLSSNHKKTNNVIFTKDKRFGGVDIKNVGPGSYETNTIVGSNKKNTKNTIFGKDNRFKENINTIPGPG